MHITTSCLSVCCLSLHPQAHHPPSCVCGDYFTWIRKKNCAWSWVVALFVCFAGVCCSEAVFSEKPEFVNPLNDEEQYNFQLYFHIYWQKTIQKYFKFHIFYFFIFFILQDGCMLFFLRHKWTAESLQLAQNATHSVTAWVLLDKSMVELQPVLLQIYPSLGPLLRHRRCSTDKRLLWLISFRTPDTAYAWTLTTLLVNASVISRNGSFSTDRATSLQCKIETVQFALKKWGVYNQIHMRQQMHMLTACVVASTVQDECPICLSKYRMNKQ